MCFSDNSPAPMNYQSSTNLQGGSDGARGASATPSPAPIQSNPPAPSTGVFGGTSAAPTGAPASGVGGVIQNTAPRYSLSPGAPLNTYGTGSGRVVN